MKIRNHRIGDQGIGRLQIRRLPSSVSLASRGACGLTPGLDCYATLWP